MPSHSDEQQAEPRCRHLPLQSGEEEACYQPRPRKALAVEPSVGGQDICGRVVDWRRRRPAHASGRAEWIELSVGPWASGTTLGRSSREDGFLGPELPAGGALAPASNNSMGLPSGSSTWICDPPGPVSIALRNFTPAVRITSTRAGKSVTSMAIRFQPPGCCRRPSGIGREPELPGPLSHRTKLP
jgi:hypothetical protein